MKKAIIVLALGISGCYVAERPMKLRVIHTIRNGDSTEAWGLSGRTWYYASFDTLPKSIHKGAQLILYPRNDSTCGCPIPYAFKRAPK